MKFIHCPVCDDCRDDIKTYGDEDKGLARWKNHAHLTCLNCGKQTPYRDWEDNQ